MGVTAEGRVRHQPQRTCVGCRRRAGRSDLLRVVAAEEGGKNVVVLDPRRRLPGRGLWVHPDEQCVGRAQRRSGFVRGLRLAGPVDTTRVVEQLHAVLQDGLQDEHGTHEHGTHVNRPTDDREREER